MTQYGQTTTRRAMAFLMTTISGSGFALLFNFINKHRRIEAECSIVSKATTCRLTRNRVSTTSRTVRTVWWRPDGVRSNGAQFHFETIFEKEFHHAANQ